MTVSISDQAKALIALEAERVALYARARRVGARQIALTETFQKNMKQLSNEHHLILGLMAKLDETEDLIAFKGD